MHADLDRLVRLTENTLLTYNCLCFLGWGDKTTFGSLQASCYLYLVRIPSHLTSTIYYTRNTHLKNSYETLGKEEIFLCPPGFFWLV